MDWDLGWFAIFVGPILAAALVSSFVPRFMAWHNRARAVAWGFRADETPPPFVTRGLASLYRGSLVGMALGLAVGFAVASLHGETDGTELLSIDGAVPVGCVLGVFVSGINVEARRSNSPIRVARLRTVSLSDYVLPLFRLVVWAAIALCVAQTALAALLAVSYPSRANHARVESSLWTCSLLTGGALVALLVFEVAGRVLVRRPQVAASDDELVWGDALRGTVLNFMLGAPLFVGVFAAQQSFFLIDAPVQWVQVVVWVPEAAIGLALIVGGVVVSRRGPQRQYLRRLWPKRARECDQTVAPGNYWAEVAEHEALNNRRRLKREAAKGGVAP